MKKHFNLLNFALVLAISGLIYIGYDYYKYSQFVAKIEAINARIDYLQNEGYSLEASKHITDVEFGLVPADAEYNALIED
ncbi:MAG: hypothetical protein V4666_08030 [Bacteroidota bacterium]